MKFRPAAVPLITVDPFFSVWSTSDTLYGAPTEHWSGKPCPILAGVFVDDVFYSAAAFDPDGKIIRRRIYQRCVRVTPTSSVYSFENELLKLELTFMTPLLLNRLDIMSRPVSYVEYKVEPKCDKRMRFVFGISSRASVDNKDQRVIFKKTDYSLCVGNAVQTPLSQSGDNVMIDWGYLHLCERDAKAARIVDQNGRLELYPINSSYNAYSDEPYLLTVREEQRGVVTLAYDDIRSIEYFGDQLEGGYRRYFDSFDSMARASVLEYPEIKKLCEDFDAELSVECAELGEDYKNILSLAYRQAIGAHKLVYDRDGELLFLSKENDSNGCIGTLDVTYPSIPLFLKYAPELVKGMLRPIIKFAKSDAWKFDFAPHDVGQYPLANGQVYGAAATPVSGVGSTFDMFRGELSENMQMPVEEIGNMLISLAAVKKYSGGDKTLFDSDKELMKKWVDYIVRYGYDPENQLCTDDFAGHLAHNCNLSLKAIIAIAAYSDLSGDLSYMDIAKEYAARWEKDARASHGATRLTFDTDCGWSLKYNIVWDALLGYSLFSEDLKREEVRMYLSKLNRYGTPLDSRSDYTKLDWLMWSTCITDDKDYFNAVTESIVNMINETADRVPLTDWYYSSTADYRCFRNRTVVGGLFINLLKQHR